MVILATRGEAAFRVPSCQVARHHETASGFPYINSHLLGLGLGFGMSTAHVPSRSGLGGSLEFLFPTNPYPAFYVPKKCQRLPHQSGFGFWVRVTFWVMVLGYCFGSGLWCWVMVLGLGYGFGSGLWF